MFICWNLKVSILKNGGMGTNFKTHVHVDFICV